MYDIIGIDMPCLDLNVNVEHFPKPDGGESVRQLSWQGGGKVATGIVAAARLGASCCMAGAVGDDRYGSFCLSDFLRHGISVDGMKRRAGRTTSLSIVLSDYETGSRSIVYHEGTAERLLGPELPIALIESARMLFVSYVDSAVMEAAAVAKRKGVPVLIDADHDSPALREMLPRVDYFIASEFVYQAMFQDERYEKNCASVLEKGPRAVVVTLGKRGCVGMDAEGFFMQPGFSVDVRDTVGAGDVFHGALASGLLMGLSLQEAAELSCAVAAIKCTRIGGRAGIPTLPVARRFIETGKIDYDEIDRRVAFYERGLEHA